MSLLENKEPFWGAIIIKVGSRKKEKEASSMIGLEEIEGKKKETLLGSALF